MLIYKIYYPQLSKLIFFSAYITFAYLGGALKSIPKFLSACFFRFFLKLPCTKWATFYLVTFKYLTKEQISILNKVKFVTKLCYQKTDIKRHPGREIQEEGDVCTPLAGSS